MNRVLLIDPISAGLALAMDSLAERDRAKLLEAGRYPVVLDAVEIKREMPRDVELSFSNRKEKRAMCSGGGKRRLFRV